MVSTGRWLWARAKRARQQNGEKRRPSSPPARSYICSVMAQISCPVAGRGSFLAGLAGMLAAELLAELIGRLHHEGQLLQCLADRKSRRRGRDRQRCAQGALGVAHWHRQT